MTRFTVHQTDDPVVAHIADTAGDGFMMIGVDAARGEEIAATLTAAEPLTPAQAAAAAEVVADRLSTFCARAEQAVGETRTGAAPLLQQLIRDMASAEVETAVKQLLALTDGETNE